MSTDQPASKDTGNEAPQPPISHNEFARRDEALTRAIDDLEKDIFTENPKPRAIGGMF